LSRGRSGGLGACNVGGPERTVRFVVGVVFLALALLAPVDPVWRAVFALLAMVGLGTAVVRYCPLNTLMGRNSCRRSEAGVR
jgi:hypothetical protein